MNNTEETIEYLHNVKHFLDISEIDEFFRHMQGHRKELSLITALYRYKYKEYFDEIIQLLKRINDGRLLVMPCKIGTPIYYIGCVSCKNCQYGNNQTYDFGSCDSSGEPYADDCEEECPLEVRTMEFAPYYLTSDGTLSSGWYFTKEEAEKELKNIDEIE